MLWEIKSCSNKPNNLVKVVGDVEIEVEESVYFELFPPATQVDSTASEVNKRHLTEKSAYELRPGAEIEAEHEVDEEDYMELNEGAIPVTTQVDTTIKEVNPLLLEENRPNEIVWMKIAN